VRFSLQDVKKSVQRRGGELTVSLYFIRPGELHHEIAQLIAYHEHLLRRPQRLFSLDDARASIGDYRLAHCLIATLSHWYLWRQRAWSEVLQEIPYDQDGSELLTLTSPIQLRLALYDYVNEHYHGFLDTQTRTNALQSLATMYQVSIVDLEYLLALDSEEEALLMREAEQPPTPQEVATLYNQWVFEAALFNASDVHFTLDCRAFAALPSMGLQSMWSSQVNMGVGAVIKRLCYLARKLGVYYDLAYEATLLDQNAAPLLLHLALYGPQEVTGAPQQYGLRLARLCRMLLLPYPQTLPYPQADRKKEGFNAISQPAAQPDLVYLSKPNTSSDSAPAKAGKGSKKQKIHASAVVEAQATVHFLQRSYTFVMDADVLQLLLSPSADEASNGRGGAESSPLFDSGIEQSFSEAFEALASRQGVDGWHLEREPEPLLLDSSIFIPDFAFTRGQHRIYVEILGFWTPAYRERKIQKLQQLQGRGDLLLAIPVEAKDAFACILPHFPVVIYDGQLSATEVLQVLRKRYDDFAERLASIDREQVRQRVREAGLLTEQACYEVLHCYRRSEIPLAAEQILDEAIRFLPGIGLYHCIWMEQLQQECIEWLKVIRSGALSEILREMRERWPILSTCDAATIEALLSMWPEVSIRRDSIFEAVVEVKVDEPEQAEVIQGEEETLVTAETEKAVKKPAREKRASTKKRVVKEQNTVQGDLWG
jgi:predicted nuclease of restriction endonuclease-like RecB superfamily